LQSPCASWERLGLMASRQPLVLISSCKAEKRTLRAGFKQLGRRLRASQCEVQKVDAAAGLAPELLSKAAVLVFGCPTQPFTLEELDALRQYVAAGGNLLVLSSEGGEARAGTNLNYLLEEYGMSFAPDCAIQSTFRK
jgi:intraflagellar transport protein 52